MSKKNSYTDLMKKTVMDRQKHNINYMQNLFIEMLLNEVLLSHSLDKISRQIDSALDSKDQALFHQLSTEKTALLKRLGT
ncbi:uncharacterized protein YpiB (UPF0302 family) [Peribacillus deserti]|uniref:Uncharacterized protein YpiB (UPF0302 family) n=1 Tax=Peribacillus deserti TaxID=673318 RepID=A0ABS2QLH3_9BACI|nr:IDEAL domain-containing protein [Peribacillus deserti]MBM7694018.1 uncharacterized protein YpiB (UPF0302 family) [Peribacillus deserti]